MRVLFALIALFLSYNASAAEVNVAPLDSYLSDFKRQEFGYDYQKVEAQSSMLRDSWIQPIRIRYNYSKSNPYDSEQTIQNAAIVLDQPIFQSGGIYFAIKYADAMRKYSNYSVDVAKRKLIKDAISLLMEIKKSKLSIEKQQLLIENATINFEQKEELSQRCQSSFFL